MLGSAACAVLQQLSNFYKSVLLDDKGLHTRCRPASVLFLARPLLLVVLRCFCGLLFMCQVLLLQPPTCFAVKPTSLVELAQRPCVLARASPSPRASRTLLALRPRVPPRATTFGVAVFHRCSSSRRSWRTPAVTAYRRTSSTTTPAWTCAPRQARWTGPWLYSSKCRLLETLRSRRTS